MRLMGAKQVDLEISLHQNQLIPKLLTLRCKEKVKFVVTG